MTMITQPPATDPSAPSDAAIAQAFREFGALGSFYEPKDAAGSYNWIKKRAREIDASAPAAAVGGHTVGEVITANDGRKFKFLGYGNYEELPSKTAFVHGPAAPVVGFVVVPSKIHVDADAWESASLAFGGPATGEGEAYMDCTLWIGEQERDDGSKVHGMHVSCNECPEEGSITLAEFTSPTAQPSAKDGVRVPKKEYCPVTDWDGMPVEEDGWQLDVLVKLREALPTVGLNGWTTGVDVLSWAIERLQATTASGLVGGVVSDAMVVKALGVWFQDPNYQRDVADHVPEQVTRMRAALQSVWPGEKGEDIDGWKHWSILERAICTAIDTGTIRLQDGKIVAVVGEPVAFSVVGPDGKNSIADGWFPMHRFADTQAITTLREGHRYVFAYTQKETTP